MKSKPDISEAYVRVQTLGGFRLWRGGEEVSANAWGRDKAIQLFQFLVTNRRKTLHKEQIIDQLWPVVELDIGDRDFKVALNAINKVLEPERTPRAQPRFIQRSGLTYRLYLETIWVDAASFETYLMEGNQVLETDPVSARTAYQGAIELYHGDYLPERRYEDWASSERERLQTLALGTLTKLAGLILTDNPLESIRLTEQALSIDPVWEDAYRTQMRAYLATGNRPLAIRTYQRCAEVLRREFDLDPLPETQEIYKTIIQAT